MSAESVALIPRCAECGHVLATGRRGALACVPRLRRRPGHAGRGRRSSARPAPSASSATPDKCSTRAISRHGQTCSTDSVGRPFSPAWTTRRQSAGTRDARLALRGALDSPNRRSRDSAACLQAGDSGRVVQSGVLVGTDGQVGIEATQNPDSQTTRTSINGLSRSRGRDAKPIRGAQRVRPGQ